MVQQIIINADDFGKSPSRNQAIHDSFVNGMIHSAGIIVTGKHLQNAVELMNKGGYVDKVHLHVNLSTNLLHENSEDIPLSEEMKYDSLFCINGRFKPYNGLPRSFVSIRKWRVVYKEIVAQYLRFKELTKGQGDMSHIDFHLWYNLTWPVSVALNLFSWKYHIKSVRYIGEHQKHVRRFMLFRCLSWKPFVKSVHSTNIDYYLSRRSALCRFSVIELYCHPNYKENGLLLDDSPSYLKHERKSMQFHIQQLNSLDDIQFVSWLSFKRKNSIRWKIR